ncbi:MAG: hypothetical protein J1F12_05720 [Muribaculaceae bacterium]|nr:hypothetical protein [Muribaculaceae bacterium]
MGKYDDIINMPHHVSDFHKPMPIRNRAAQFAPFAALTGHEDAIEEVERITELFSELSETEKNLISQKLNKALEFDLLVKITFFVPDRKKKGGKYKSLTGRIKKWEKTDQVLVMENGKNLPVEFISEIYIIKNDEDF